VAVSAALPLEAAVLGFNHVAGSATHDAPAWQF